MWCARSDSRRIILCSGKLETNAMFVFKALVCPLQCYHKLFVIESQCILLNPSHTTRLIPHTSRLIPFVNWGLVGWCDGAG